MIFTKKAANVEAYVVQNTNSSLHHIVSCTSNGEHLHKEVEQDPKII